MPNEFEQFIGQPRDPNRPPANEFEQFVASPSRPPARPRGGDGRSPNDPWWHRAARTADDAVRSGVDTLTFGLFDKALAATGAEPDAPARTAQAQKESPYASIAGSVAGGVLPGVGASAALSRFVPALAGPSIAALAGNGAATGLGLSAADDILRGNMPDPTKAAISTVAGGVAAPAIAGISRLISPSARFRAAGVGVTDAEKAAAEQAARDAAGRGIQLSVPEALRGTSTSRAAAGVKQAFDDASTSPAGARVIDSFSRSREPGLLAARRGVTDAFGPGVTPQAASGAADDAIRGADRLVKNSAQPHFRAADNTPLPTGEADLAAVGFTRPDVVSVREARRRVSRDPVRMAEMAQRQSGGSQAQRIAPDFNTVRGASALLDDIDSHVGGLLARNPPKTVQAAPRAAAATRLRETLAQTSDDWATGQQISRDGGEMVRGLEAGPLGRIRSAQDTASQHGALFGATNEVEKEAARIAAERLPGPIRQGILANRVQSSIDGGTDPFANRAGRDIADIVNPGAVRNTEGVRESLTMVQPTPNMGVPQPHSGAMGQLWGAIRDYGRGPIAEKMIDPNNIPLLGVLGRGQAGANATAQSVLQEAMPGIQEVVPYGGRRRRRRTEDLPEITVRGR